MKHNESPLKKIFELTQHEWDHPAERAAVRDNFRKVCACRTPALGGEVYASAAGEKVFDHTCKSKCCPSCGNRATLLWLEEQWAALPDISFVGIVLTMPKVFWPVFKAHRHLQHDLPALGAAVLQQWAWNLYQVRLHIIVIQHTFGGRLNHFPHLHMMVSAGGLKPALQPAPAGGGRRKFVREKMLRRTGLQNPQKALETRPIRGRVSAPLIPSLLRLRQQGLNQFPVLVRQQLLPCFHDRSSPD